MASDEIAQVCELEVQGVTMAVKGGVQAASWLLQAIKAMLTSAHDKSLNSGGNKSMLDIWELSKNEAPAVIDIPEKYYEEILSIAQSQGLRFHACIDMDPSDSKLPIALPPQDVAMFSAIVKPFLEKDISAAERVINSYNEDISELKERQLNATPEERAKLDIQREQLERAKEQLEALVSEEKEDLAGANVMSFTDYLAKGVGTEFEKDPDKAVSEYEKGVELSKSFAASECMQPIREARLVPESKLRFYVPEIGATITREFSVDAATNLVSSKYTIKTDEGELFEFSDKDVTTKSWNERILPKMLDKAGITKDTQCKTFDTKEKYLAYIKYFNNVTPKSEENVEGRTEEEKKGFRLADAFKEIKTAVAEGRKARASAEESVTISIPQEELIQKDGRLIYKDPIGAEYEFKDIQPGKVENGKIEFTISGDSKVAVTEGLHLRILSAGEARTEINASLESGAENTRSRAR